MVNKYDDDVSAGAEKINLPACMYADAGIEDTTAV